MTGENGDCANGKRPGSLRTRGAIVRLCVGSAAGIVVAAAVVVAATPAVAAAAENDNQQDNDPAAVTATPAIIAHISEPPMKS